MTTFSLMVIGTIVYLIPSFVALIRHHHNTKAIIMLNVFLGFTYVGWVIALVWSFANGFSNSKVK